MWNVRLDKAQAGIKIAERNIHNLRYADGTTLMAESKDELKTFLMKVKEESEKAGLKLNIQKTKTMASSPIVSLQTDGWKVETVTDFIFLGSKITADGDNGHEINRRLLLGRKTMTIIDSMLKLTIIDSMLKRRDITLSTKVKTIKAMAFPGVVSGCESWNLKEAEHQRTDAIKLWCWDSIGQQDHQTSQS